MEFNDNFSEDEWSVLRRRFSAEGVPWEGEEAEERVLHLWRWLTDAEDNLRAARNISDKMRRQHSEEEEEAQQRLRVAEQEAGALRSRLDDALAGSAAVTAMLLKEGLADIARSSLPEQVAYLLVERNRLVEDLEERSGPVSNRGKELTAQLIKVSTELELSRRGEAEAHNARDAVQGVLERLEKRVQQLKMDNDSLAFKVSEAYAELEEREEELRLIRKCGCQYKTVSSDSRLDQPAVEAPIPIPPHLVTRQRPSSLPFTYRAVSSSPREYSPPLSERISKRDHTEASKPRSCRRSSRLTYQGTYDQCLDERPGDVGLHQEEVADLQAESSALRLRLLTSEDRLEAAIKGLEVYKIRSRTRLAAIRLRHREELQQRQAKERNLERKVTAADELCKAQEARCGVTEKELLTLQQEQQQLRLRTQEVEAAMSSLRTSNELAEEKNVLLQDAHDRLKKQVKSFLIKEGIEGMW